MLDLLLLNLLLVPMLLPLLGPLVGRKNRLFMGHISEMQRFQGRVERARQVDEAEGREAIRYADALTLLAQGSKFTVGKAVQFKPRVDINRYAANDELYAPESAAHGSALPFAS